MRKVTILMSGGVDSSVAAALLKRAVFDPHTKGAHLKFGAKRSAPYGVGVDVRGVFMRLVDLANFKEGEKKAKKIAEILNIPFLTFDLRKEFKQKIIDCFLKEYKAGTTPNPCVVCNKEIKFGLLLDKALQLDADFIATGHYARTNLSNLIFNKNLRLIQAIALNRRRYGVKLFRAKDREKDQSYFLWQLNQKQLKHILFPLGNYTKIQVKKLAKNWNLPVLEKESQEICFIPKTLDKFLESKIKTKKGQILNLEGKVIGEHKGLAFYTIGQRRGIELPGGPFYVVKKDLKKNILIVTPFFDDKLLYSKNLIAKNVNWVAGKEPKLPLKIKAQIRYGHKAVSATITKKLKTKNYELIFSQPQRAVTPGQSVVFYSTGQILRDKTWGGQGQELLGGGIIC